RIGRGHRRRRGERVIGLEFDHGPDHDAEGAQRVLEGLELGIQHRIDPFAGLVARPEPVAERLDDVIRGHAQVRRAPLEHAEHRGHDAAHGPELLRGGALERRCRREEVTKELVRAVDQMDDHDPTIRQIRSGADHRRKIFTCASSCRAWGREAPPARPPAARVTEIMQVNTADAYVDTIALSRDGSRIAIGQRNGSIRVWTPRHGTEPAPFGPPPPAASALPLPPPGELLASLGLYRDGTLRLWRPGVGASPWS